MIFYDSCLNTVANDLGLAVDQILELKRLGVLDRDTACQLLGIPPEQMRGNSKRKQLYNSMKRRQERSDW